MRRSPIRKRSANARLIDYLDAMLRALVLHRDGYRCLKCGTVKNLTAAHIYPKGKYQAMRYLLDNVFTLCWLPCHDGWWHKHPIGATEWANENLGPVRMRNLRLIASFPGKVDRELDRLHLESEMTQRELPLPAYKVGKRGPTKRRARASTS